MLLMKNRNKKRPSTKAKGIYILYVRISHNKSHFHMFSFLTPQFMLFIKEISRVDMRAIIEDRNSLKASRIRKNGRPYVI
ncbi:hypothetical protein M378DRAFT_1001335 [Amanita muscaria Koide BX008]|uniref:Uncharacterized protein n=1 Tax=Amanita muscaria (strain Koide BX008) TaxID=946122 RepID=A0A0C2S9Y3_AMAMK|nr:hypothetical protein M378DRAFT_1001335 [Amanita muscaria Koide BX008]